MIDYHAPVADVRFALRAAAEADRLPRWDDDLAGTVLSEAARLIDHEIAPLDPIGDRTPARLEAGRVQLPAEFVAAYQQYRLGGWPGLAMPEEYGGQGLPHLLAAAISEMLAGAAVAFQMVIGLGQGAMRTLLANGSEAQKQLWLPRLASGEWLATMCLTEPQAGSDLGQIRSVASPSADGGWRIQGSKIFISGGDQNLTGKVLHLVLARTPGAVAGVKGLALFVCPSELPGGARNTVLVSRLEDKMGMHASPTCQLEFDAARAELIGAPGEGLARMFTMMNAERLDTALQGVGLAEVAWQRSRAYASERKQGRNAAMALAPIALHADVDRMLLTQAALVQGCRAMVYRALALLERGGHPALIEFLTPLCKAFCTDAGVETAQLAIQIHGGYGYLREYRVEQIFRDARVTQIYEGTNGIQAQTLAGRVLRQPASRGAFAAEIQSAIDLADGVDANQLANALASWQAAADGVLAKSDPGYVASAFLRLSGLLLLGAMWLRLRAQADHAPDPLAIRRVAAFVFSMMLPGAASLSAICQAGFRPD